MSVAKKARMIINKTRNVKGKWKEEKMTRQQDAGTLVTTTRRDFPEAKVPRSHVLIGS